MAEIKLRADEARGHADDLKGRAADATAEFSALKSRLENLSSSFTGKTQQAFEDRLVEWKTSADGLVDALDGLGIFLSSAADSIESLDAEMASKLQG